MYRYLTAFIVLLTLGFVSQAQAQHLVTISGYLSSTRELHPRVPSNSALDTIYEISGNYDIASGAVLKVDEGAEVWFLPNSRIIDSAGGKIIANGYTGLNRRILFRGMPIDANSHEWGHIVVLPNSDSAYFSNVRFVNFRKRNTVDVTLLYNPFLDASDAAFNAQINAAINGVGGCIATFSQKTFIYDAIVDSCQASFAGAAFAFLQSPAGFPVPDDGRLALQNRQVCLLTIRDTRVYNNETTTPTSNYALGGAIFMGSNSAGYNSSDFITAMLGENAFTTGTPQNPVTFSASADVELFERCSADNTFNNTAVVGGQTVNLDYAEGGAIYVGTNTALILAQGTFNTDSAIEAYDGNAWGGAIAVSGYSGNPNQTSNGSVTDRVPGLTVQKTATFRGDVAGMGGAIHMDMPPVNLTTVPAPRLIVDAEHFIGLVRDSGKIWFDGNIAYKEGGAIYSPNKVYIKGYLAPQNFPWPGGPYSIELRVEFSNNVAAVGGGSIFLDAFSGGTPDLIERRSWHINNSVNPFDPRLNPSGGPNRGTLYGMSVIGGGAEFVGLRDSTFATEYNHNLVVGGNGGAVNLEDGVAAGNQVPINRYFVDDEYNAVNVTIPRDTFAGASIFPFDQRQLTRFIGNRAELGPDSAFLYNYNPAVVGTAHGRGGGLYVQITSDPTNQIAPHDSTFISQVRFESDTAFSGSAIWCDRYDFKFMSNLTLIANNLATSPSSAATDLDSTGISNPGDPNAGATVWADFEGSLPSYESNSRGDAIYDNMARYTLRLPVSTLIGVSGADTLRGNFWGETGPDVITEINPPTGAQQQTFFVDFYHGCFTNIFEPNSNPPVAYIPVTIGTIPDTLLMEGRIYDLFDRGTDMKVADYSNRRLAPAEAFSLGMPAQITKMHRYTRNIFDTNAVYVNKIDLYQTDFQGPHPIGYPLFLQADVPIADSNRDDFAKDYTVFMVFNTTTNEFVRVNMKEIAAAEGVTDAQQTYRGRLDFVPDSSVARRNPSLREQALYTYSLLRPSQMTFAEVQRASMLEDSAALHGREYSLSLADFNGSTPGDSICTEGIPATSKWYAGERYHTLPVRPGDNILVISRSQLWKYGPSYAIAHGLQFTIGDVLAPNFVADIPALQSDTYNPNIRFVHEDVNYDASDAAHTLFRVAGYDVNNFYDPRFLFNPGNYTQLGISVTPDLFPGDVIPTAGAPVPGQAGNFYTAAAADSVRMHVRLNHWLKQTVIYNQNITGSNGYVLLSGTPHNPDVVPGGEAVTATLTNFPPNFTSESDLLNAFPANVLGPDSLGLSMWTFPPYMNCSSGFLADTLCVRSAAAKYHFRIVVMDSLPVFQPFSVACNSAILTDSLRYDVDLQTDDELEDSAAAAEMVGPATTLDKSSHSAWDFRYGRTSYDFVTQPSWMVEPRNGQYVPIDSTDPNFLVRGIIHVRLDSLTAVTGNGTFGPYLLPNPQVNGELNLDTIIGVEANDGHTGKTLNRWPIPILFVPTITNTALDSAHEGMDYSQNFQKADSIERIIVQEPNPTQYFTYHLLYHGQTVYAYHDIPHQVGENPDGSPRLGVPDTLVGHTPNWLSIDPYSGVLTGTPGDTDAPRLGSLCGEDTVDVVVSDGTVTPGQLITGCVATWKEFLLPVDSINHPPFFVKGPSQQCVTNGVSWCDSAFVYDRDLLRGPCATETLTISSLDPRVTVKFAQNDSTAISGRLSSDTLKVTVCGQYNEDQSWFNGTTIQPEYVRLQVKDASGSIDTLTYPLHIGLKPSAFECSIWVSNAVTSLHPLQDIKQLCFGAGQFGTDSLDIIYCEFEQAPAPPKSAFDARWILPLGGQLEGSTVDVRSNANPNATLTWQVQFQPGNEAGGAGSLYPVNICWNSSCMDTSSLSGTFKTGNFYLRNPVNLQEFDINMASGANVIDNSLYTLTRISADSLCLQIRDQGLTNALIVFVPASSGVGTSAQPVFALEPNYPNPFSGTTTLNFSVAKRSSVRIDIYDEKGSLVRTLVNEQLDAGSYPVTWDGTDESGMAVPDGAYIAHMTAGSFNSTVKMSLDKGAH